MGIYGLQTWGDYYARWLQAEQREEIIRLNRLHGRMALMQALLQEQGHLEPLGEDLACPACKSPYGYGDFCPTCDVELVCESFVDAVEPVHRKVEHPAAVVYRSAAFAGAAFSVCVALTGIFLFIDPHPTIVSFQQRGPAPRDRAVPLDNSVAQSLQVPERIAFVDSGRALTHRLWVEVESEQSGTGPALHLVGPKGDLESLLDCHFGNCTASTVPLDWGIPGLFIDDPELWGDPSTDARQGVRILSPTAGIYSVVLVAPERRSRTHYPTTVRVFVDGELAFDEDAIRGTDAGGTVACQIVFPEGDVRLL